MNDTRPQITTLDLIKGVPTGVKLVGFSEPKFDGVNYYRSPILSRTGIEVRGGSHQFIQLDYQIYSADLDVMSKVILNKKEIGKYLFRKGAFDDVIHVGSFTGSQINKLEIEYMCGKPNCLKNVRQYWSKVHVINNTDEKLNEAVGFRVNRVMASDLGSKVNILGAGPIFYDGANYTRKLYGDSGSISWFGMNPLSAGAYIYAPQKFTVRTFVQGKTVAVQQGDKDNGVSVAVSLARFPEARSVSFRVECLGSPVKTGCAYLYFPQVAVSTAPPVSVGGQLGVVALVMLCLLGLWAWLRPVPVSGGGSFR